MTDDDLEDGKLDENTVRVDLSEVERARFTLPDDPDDDQKFKFVPAEVETTIVSGSKPDSRPAVSLPPGMKAQLTVIRGTDKDTVHSLSRPVNTMGRSQGCSILLGDPAASGTHAMVFFSRSREWRVQDLDSTNGTLLNGSRVKEFALRSGDKILIGETLLLFEVSR